jgi:hypothetical protein
MSSAHTKQLATQVQVHAAALRKAIKNAIEQSVVNRDEVPFIRELVATLPPSLNAAFAKAGITATTRAIEVHAKPKVDFICATGATCNRELADILFVVKYVQPNKNSYEAKAILHQAKATRVPASLICDIDSFQLELLRDWPAFEFGRVHTGGPRRYKIVPVTQEFGSYMLMRRRPVNGQYISLYRKDYGAVPTAWIVHAAGPANVNIGTLPFSLLVSNQIFNHIAFVQGEPHTTPGVQRLVNALYRYVGWKPDPPDEFDGYTVTKPTGKVDPQFAIFEVRVGAESVGRGKAHSRRRR